MSAKILTRETLSDFFNAYTVNAHNLKLLGVGELNDDAIYAVIRETSKYDMGFNSTVFVAPSVLEEAINFVENLEETSSNPLSERIFENAKPRALGSLRDIAKKIEDVNQNSLGDNQEKYERLFVQAFDM